MADEIDIEEHDIMENPAIKDRFPDLSFIKKEMLSYDEIESRPCSKQQDVQLNLMDVKQPNYKSQCIKANTAVNTKTDTLVPDNNLQSNKIILGSKPNRVSVDQNDFENWVPFQANVVLQDIKSYLQKSKRYCDICCILFPEPNDYEKHLQLYHCQKTVTDNCKGKTELKKTTDHKCGICKQHFVSKFVLNRHIANIHKPKSVNIGDRKQSDIKNIAATKIIKDNSTDLSNTCFHCKETFETQKSLIDHLYDILQAKRKSTEIVPVLKSILFKCNKCDIHFVSSEIASSHAEHMEMLINWKCSICSRIFKKEDELSHERQHSVSNNFVTYNLGEINDNMILFKCSKCSTHFTENNFIYHFRDCGLKTLSTAYCKICDILLDNEMKISHDSDHNNANGNVPFTIIETEVISDNPVKTSSKENQDQIKKKINEIANTFQEVKIVLKRLDKDELMLHARPTKEYQSYSKSTEIAKKHCESVERSFSRKWARSKLILKTTHKQEDKNISRTDDKFNSKNAQRKRRAGMDIYKTLRKMPKLAYSYCGACKCFVTKFRSTMHKQSRCAKLKRHVCNHCGLIFTYTSFLTHGKLHKENKDLKLSNFTFYNLYNGLRMNPPVPEYPNCDSCGVHFLTKIATVNHACSEESYLTCHVCEMKLSEAAFKLHMMFHHYSSDRDSESTSSKYVQPKINFGCDSKVSNKPTDNDINVHRTQLCKSDKVSQANSDEFVYTCRNCRVTVDTYDKVVEHCQGLCNVDRKEPEIVVCDTCKLNIEKKSYAEHHKLHQKEIKFKELKFDSYYFPEENNLWVKHIFKNVPNDKVLEILSKSIYRFEGRIKMEIIQQGAPNMTVYKCDKCSCFIEPTSVFKHADNSCFKLRKHPCSFCGLPFNSSASRADHEKIHNNPGITPIAYRIVLFNRELDKELNSSFCLRRKYLLYQCRYCSGIIDKLQSDIHVCDTSDLKKCPKCDLLLYSKDYDLHATAHREFDSFNYKNIKVILLGNENTITDATQRGQRSNFRGNICDYKMYRCSTCQLCIKNEKFIPKHSCHHGKPQAKCPKCSLYFSVSRLKTHMRFHERDPDFIRSNMTMISFDPLKWDPNENNAVKLVDEDCEITDSNSDSDCDIVMSAQEQSQNNNELCEKTEIVEEIVKIYKCICGLHFLNQDSILRHFGVCRSNNRVAKQECSKCNLLFTSNVLFTHMLAHHSSKNRRFKYDIMQMV